MRSKVALVACENYDTDKIEKAVRRAVDLLGGISHFVKPGGKYLLKPNLCLPEKPDRALTTHPEVVRSVAKLCLQEGADIYIGDSPVGEASNCRMETIWEESGMNLVVEELRCNKVLFNSHFTKRESIIKGQKYTYLITDQLLGMDGIINLPKFKTHSLMTFTGAIKNLYGLLPGSSKKSMHCALPDRYDFAELLLDIYQTVNHKLHIMDAVIGIEGDGPGKKGKVRHIGLILASEDGIALDSVCASLMNLNPLEIPTNKMANERVLENMSLSQIDIVGDLFTEYQMKDFLLPKRYMKDSEVVRKLFKLSKESIVIDQTKCRACQLCKSVCPAEAIYENNANLQINMQFCIACCSCLEICPEGAIDIKHSNFYQQLKNMRKEHSCSKKC